MRGPGFCGGITHSGAVPTPSFSYYYVELRRGIVQMGAYSVKGAKLKRGVVACFVVLLAACSQGWDAEAREDFREGCIQELTMSFSECGCVQGELEERGFTPDDIENYESGDALDGEMFDIAMQCAEPF